MDTLKKEQQEAQDRLRVLYEERDGLTASYKDKKKHVDELKDQLQQKINDYSKLSESGMFNYAYKCQCESTWYDFRRAE